jgi:hypothetical protein
MMSVVTGVRITLASIWQDIWRIFIHCICALRYSAYCLLL